MKFRNNTKRKKINLSSKLTYKKSREGNSRISLNKKKNIYLNVNLFTLQNQAIFFRLEVILFSFYEQETFFRFIIKNLISRHFV